MNNKKNKTVTIFVASPRANGNSEKLANRFIEGCMEQGYNINSITIRERRILGCNGCEYCYDHEGECCIKDDMQLIYRILETTNLIVFATPIYYQSFPSQLKAVIDRLYVTENRSFPITDAILLATCATKGSEMSFLTREYYRTLISYHGWNNLGEIMVDGLDGKDDICKHPALDEAFNLGKKIYF